MVDNVELPSGSGGATVRTDDDGTAHWQYVKLAYGADNTQTIVTSTATNPLPVALSDTDNAVLDNIQTAVELVDDAIFADDAAFTLASSKVMVTGAIRDDALSTLTAVEGDAVPLRVSSTGALHVTGGGGGTEYTQDAAHTDPATGATFLMARDDALATQESADGDWTIPRANARGAQWVELDLTNDVTIADGGNSITVDNAGTFATQVDGDALTALQLIDDIVFTDDTSTHATGTTKGAGIMAAATPTDGSVAANDIGMLAMSTDRRLHTDTQIVGQDADITIADGGNSITVDNAGLTELAAAINGSQVDVDIKASDVDLMLGTDFSNVLGTASLILGTQADNLANTSDGLQTTTFLYGFDGTTWDRLHATAGDLHIHDGGNSITVDNAGTFATQVDGDALTALQLIDDIVFTDDTSTHSTGSTKGAGIMAAATPTDGSVAANDIGMLAMSTDRRLHTDAQIVGQDANLTVDLGATDNAVLDSIQAAVEIIDNTVATEDAAAAANPIGNHVALVRQDTPATLVSADGDVVAQRATNYGAAFVQILDSSGNFINSFGGSGGTSHADDAAFTIGSASSVTPTAYLADETTPDSVDEGDVGVPRMTLSRKPYAVITDATSENNAAVDGSGHLQVDIAASSATVTVDMGANNDVTVQGEVAHDAAASGANPVLVGHEARTTNPTAVANGDLVRAMADDLGRQIVVMGAPRDLTTNNHVSLSVSTTITLLAAGGAGVFRDLTSLTMSNSSDTAAFVTIYDGLAAGTQKFVWELAANGGGLTMSFDPPFKQTTANNGWAIKSTETGLTATAQAVDTV